MIKIARKHGQGITAATLAVRLVTCPARFGKLSARKSPTQKIAKMDFQIKQELDAQFKH